MEQLEPEATPYGVRLAKTDLHWIEIRRIDGDWHVVEVHQDSGEVVRWWSYKGGNQACQVRAMLDVLRWAASDSPEPQDWNINGQTGAIR